MRLQKMLALNLKVLYFYNSILSNRMCDMRKKNEQNFSIYLFYMQVNIVLYLCTYFKKEFISSVSEWHGVKIQLFQILNWIPMIRKETLYDRKHLRVWGKMTWKLVYPHNSLKHLYVLFVLIQQFYCFQ